MNNKYINKRLITDYNIELNDKESDLMIKEIFSLINNYFKATKGNYLLIENNYKMLNNGYKHIQEIMPIFIANKNNLDNFVLDMNISFKKLKDMRKIYLNRVSKYINDLLAKKSNNNPKLKKNNFNEIINLIYELYKYSETFNYISPKQKEKYEEKLSIIINELEIKEMNNINQISLLNKEIYNLKNELIKAKTKFDSRMGRNQFPLKDNKIFDTNIQPQLIKKPFIKVNNENFNIINNSQKENLLINNNNSLNEKIILINKEIENKNNEIKELKKIISEEGKEKELLNKKYKETIFEMEQI